MMATAYPEMSQGQIKVGREERLLAAYQEAAKKGHLAALEAVYELGRDDQSEADWASDYHDR